MRAIIIDDEEIGIDSLKLLIEKFVPDVKVVAQTTEAEKGVDLISDYRPEIVFLDINMPFLNGFELLQKLTFKNFNLIFTTAHNEYALKAIKNNALDYLLKPISSEDLIAAINKARKFSLKDPAYPEIFKLLPELLHPSDTRVSLVTKNGIEKVEQDQIVRIESKSNYTNFILSTGKIITVSKTLRDYERILCNDKSAFMRVNVSNIVNINHVKKYSADKGGVVTTSDNSQIILSKLFRQRFMTWFNELINTSVKRDT